MMSIYEKQQLIIESKGGDFVTVDLEYVIYFLKTFIYCMIFFKKDAFTEAVIKG